MALSLCLYAQAVGDIRPQKYNPPIIAFVSQSAKSGKYVTTMNAGYELARLFRSMQCIA